MDKSDDPFASCDKTELRELVEACNVKILYPAICHRVTSATQASQRVKALEHRLGKLHESYLASLPGMACHVPILLRSTRWAVPTATKERDHALHEVKRLELLNVCQALEERMEVARLLYYRANEAMVAYQEDHKKCTKALLYEDELRAKVKRLKWPTLHDPLADGDDSQDPDKPRGPVGVDHAQLGVREADRVYRLLSRAYHPDKCVVDTEEQKLHYQQRFQELSRQHLEGRQLASEQSTRAKPLGVDMVDSLLMLNTFASQCEAAARVLEDDIEKLEGELASCMLTTKQVLGWWPEEPGSWQGVTAAFLTARVEKERAMIDRLDRFLSLGLEEVDGYVEEAAAKVQLHECLKGLLALAVKENGRLHRYGQRIINRLERQVERLERKAARSNPPTSSSADAQPLADSPQPAGSDADAKTGGRAGKWRKAQPDSACEQPGKTRKAAKHAQALQQAQDGEVVGRKALKKGRRRAEQQQEQEEEGGKKGRRRRDEDEDEDVEDEEAWRVEAAAQVLGVPADSSAAMLQAVYRIWTDVFDTDKAIDLSDDMRKHYRQQAERVQTAYSLLMNNIHHADGDSDDELAGEAPRAQHGGVEGSVDID